MDDDSDLDNEKNKEKIKIKDIHINKEALIINLEFRLKPNNLTFSHDIIESYTNEALDNTFLVFKSINDIFYLIYSNLDNSIIAYNLINYKKIIEIKNANYWSYFTNFRHYLDKFNKRDLMLSISYDNNIKLWNINNWKNILKINYINKVGYLYSAFFLNDNNQIYIISSNYYLDSDSEPMKVFDLSGNQIKYIYSSYNDNTYFIDSFYDKKMFKNYIIAGNKDYVISYDYNENMCYHKYYDNNNKDHISLVINDIADEINLIDSCEDGFIRIWNFYSGKLIKKIKVCHGALYGVCLWNKDFIFVGCKDKSIKLIDLENNKIISNLVGHNARVLSIKKIIHPEYGECLFSQGYGFNQVKLWINEK